MRRFFLLLLTSLFALTGRAADLPKLTPAEAARLVAAGGAILIDVREPSEWADSGVAAPALLLAKSDFDGARKSWAPVLKQHRADTLILYCRSGRRSAAVAAVLAQEGYKVANAGGFADWQAAGLPVRQP